MRNVRCLTPLGAFRRWRALPLRQQWQPGGPRGLHARAGDCPSWPSSARPSARRPVPTAAPRTASASTGRARRGHVENRPNMAGHCGPSMTGRCLGRPEPRPTAARSLPRASCTRPEPRCFRYRCEAAFAGLDCSSKRCPNDCGGESNGLCMADGVCECHDGFGPRTPGGVNDCLGRLCANACGPHGTCATPERASARASRAGRGARVPSRGVRPCARGTACATRAPPSPPASATRATRAPTAPRKVAFRFRAAFRVGV